MLKWQHLFSAAILQRGRDYYRKNRVRSLIRDGDLYYATVEGSEDYQVSIRIEGDKPTEMSCECPYAGDGGRCKHMAAALYEIAARDVPVLPTAKKAAKDLTGVFLFRNFAGD